MNIDQFIEALYKKSKRSKKSVSELIREGMEKYENIRIDYSFSALKTRFYRYKSKIEKNKKKKKVKKKPPTPEEERESYDFKQLERDYNGLRRKMQGIESIYDKFSSLIKHRKTPSRLPVILDPSSESQVMFVNFGDSHVGKEVDNELTGGIAEYNLEIFAMRLKYYTSKIIEKFALHNSDTPIKKVVINFLGDIIDNDAIYKGHRNYVEMGSIDQVIATQDFLSSFLDTLYHELGVPLDLHCVFGNHGRIGRKNENKYHMNFDYLIYKNLEREFKNYEHINFDVPKVWFSTYEEYGQNFLCMHGDDIRSWMSIPYYGIERAKRRYSAMLKKFFLATIMGHFHGGASFGVSTDEVLVNGAFDGGDLFSMKVLHTVSHASQLIFGLSDQGCIDWRYKVLLDF